MPYKVEFKENSPVKATFIHSSSDVQILEFEEESKQPLLKYMCVEAADEKNAVEMAARIFKNIWGEILSTTGS